MHNKHRENGQVISEYSIALFALLVALFVPWNGETSAVANFLNSVRAYHAQASFPLSLP
jgi:hypothetical protein